MPTPAIGSHQIVLKKNHGTVNVILFIIITVKKASKTCLFPVLLLLDHYKKKPLNHSVKTLKLFQLFDEIFLTIFFSPKMDQNKLVFKNINK